MILWHLHSATEPPIPLPGRMDLASGLLLARALVKRGDQARFVRGGG